MMAQNATTSAPKHPTSLTLVQRVARDYTPNVGVPFGSSPAFQNVVAGSVGNVFANGDAITGFAWQTTDLKGDKTGMLEADFGLSYSPPPINVTKKTTLSLVPGIQLWKYPTKGVVSTKDDWLLDGTAAASYAGRTTVVASLNAKVQANGRPGKSFYYATVKAEHTLVSDKNDGWRLVLNHGPEYAHSKGFFGFEGPLHVSYGADLEVRTKDAAISFGYRPQLGIGKTMGGTPIPNQHDWQFQVRRTFRR